MIRMQGGELSFVGLCYVFRPALLMYMNGASGRVVNTHSGFFAADGTSHDSLPLFCVSPDFAGLAPLPFSALESVT
jgi:hypothetical protein